MSDGGGRWPPQDPKDFGGWLLSISDEAMVAWDRDVLSEHNIDPVAWALEVDEFEEKLDPTDPVRTPTVWTSDGQVWMLNFASISWKSALEDSDELPEYKETRLGFGWVQDPSSRLLELAGVRRKQQ